jgi:glycine cleavage system H protein
VVAVEDRLTSAAWFPAPHTFFVFHKENLPMSHIPENVYYTEQHEWIRLEPDGAATCGITDHAQEMLNDIVFVELPEPGRRVRRGDPVAVIESVKAVSDVYTPAGGTIVRVNSALEEQPELMNRDPYGEGWLFALEGSDRDEIAGLLDPAAYGDLVAREEEQQ